MVQGSHFKSFYFIFSWICSLIFMSSISIHKDVLYMIWKHFNDTEFCINRESCKFLNKTIHPNCCVIQIHSIQCSDLWKWRLCIFNYNDCTFLLKNIASHITFIIISSNSDFTTLFSANQYIEEMKCYRYFYYWHKIIQKFFRWNWLWN